VSRRLAFVGVLTLAACGDPQPREIASPVAPLEAAIAHDLSARFTTSATSRCVAIATVPIRCEAVLKDGTRLPIAIANERGAWAWRLDGIAVESRVLVAHIAQLLADLRVPQAVDCGGAVHVVAAGARITCKLGGGGAAFVRVAADGTTALEIALDAASAAARGEQGSVERERELDRMSKALEALEGESDGEDEVRGDGGVAKP
jgi:hypothetical protein